MQNLDKRNLTLLLGVVLVVLAGLYAWLWALFRDMVQNLACIVDGITEGKDMGGNVTAAMEELPPSTVKALQDSRPVFLTLTALPNAITWITLVVYVISGKCACFGGPDSQARKILYYFTIFIMLLGMGFLLGVGIQGSRFATGSIPEVDLICSDYLDATRTTWSDLNDKMQYKKARLDNLNWGGNTVNETLREALNDQIAELVDEAEEPLEHYLHLEKLCNCGHSLIPIIAYAIAPCFIIVVVYVATLGILYLHNRATDAAQDVTVKKSGEAEMATSTSASATEAKAEGI